MLSRRQFMQRPSLVSLYPIVPSLLSRIACAAPAESDANVLVVIQLDGGNDGINTVVPFADDGYGRNRTALRLASNELHKLDDHVGLHPQMKAAKALFNDGRLTVVQGVGYPNPDRSHFRSMRIWQTARLDADEYASYGWIGRALDEQKTQPVAAEPGAIYVGEGDPPVALWGRRSEAMSMASFDGMKLPYLASQLSPALPPNAGEQADNNALGLFTTRQVLSAYAAVDQFQRQLETMRGQPAFKYPESQLAAHLELISQLIKSGSAARVFYASQGSYDTHASQLYTHAGLLSDLSQSLKSFLDDLKKAGIEDRVLVLVFSEFGRRLKENDSQGTDHGAAAPMFLAGGKTIGGLVGPAPNLTDLDNGDVKMSVDLREIYATVLEDWLRIPSKAVLGGSFAKAKILRA